MPGSPFPGMDPYLEHPQVWPNVHDRLIIYLSDALNQKLPPGYVTAIGERVYVERSERSIYPDVILSERRDRFVPGRQQVAVLEIEADPAWEIAVEYRTFREPFVEILALEPDRRVVTLVEVLSPTNKRTGSTGRREYLAKQEEIWQSGVSLLELDLLRSGEHTVAASLEWLRVRGEWTYLACLSDATRNFAYSVWPIGLRNSLPRVRIPLGEGDPPITIALQELLEQVYSAGRFDRLINYRADPPPPPFAAEDAAWIAERLRTASEEA